MIVTEEEAGTKRCCGPKDCGQSLVRVPSQYAAHPELNLGPRMCIGSACMAWIWRWVPGETSKTNGSCGYAGDHGTLDHSGR